MGARQTIGRKLYAGFLIAIFCTVAVMVIVSDVLGGSLARDALGAAGVQVDDYYHTDHQVDAGRSAWTPTAPVPYSDGYGVRRR